MNNEGDCMDNSAKLRPLYLAKILYEKTDEEHYLTTAQLAQILEEQYGITSHRNDNGVVVLNPGSTFALHRAERVSHGLLPWIGDVVCIICASAGYSDIETLGTSASAHDQL